MRRHEIYFLPLCSSSPIYPLPFPFFLVCLPPPKFPHSRSRPFAQTARPTRPRSDLASPWFALLACLACFSFSLCVKSSLACAARACFRCMWCFFDIASLHRVLHEDVTQDKSLDPFLQCALGIYHETRDIPRIQCHAFAVTMDTPKINQSTNKLTLRS